MYAPAPIDAGGVTRFDAAPPADDASTPPYDGGAIAMYGPPARLDGGGILPAYGPAPVEHFDGGGTALYAAPAPFSIATAASSPSTRARPSNIDVGVAIPCRLAPAGLPRTEERQLVETWVAQGRPR